jgi:hypothetical protein
LPNIAESYRFEPNVGLAQEILSKAGPNHVYNRPDHYHEVANVTKVFNDGTQSIQYKVNEDSEPVKIVRPIEPLTQKQNVRVRYLEPPEPPVPAPIIVKERQLTPPPPPPPIVIRQKHLILDSLILLFIFFFFFY